MAKFNIQNLNELSDGKELLESKPNKFTRFFIYILFAILISFLLWAWFSTKEVVISVPGIVISNDDTYSISTMLTGAVKSINIKNGQYVKTGDVLFTLDTKNDKTQLGGLEEQEKALDRNINDLNNLVKAINGDSNFINNENKYYSEYNSYLTQNNIINSEVNANNSIINNIRNQINGLNNLVRSIQDNKNYVANNPLYNSQYESYENSKQSLENKINSLNTQRETLTNELNNEKRLQSDLINQENNLNKEKEKILKDEKNNTNTVNSDSDKINKEEKIQDITNKINDIQSKMQNEGSNTNLTNQINNVNAEVESTNSQIANLENTTISQIESQIQTLNNQLNEVQGNNNKTSLNKPLNKYQLLSQINGTLNTYKNNDEQLKIKIKELKDIVNNGEVKANHNGVIYIPQLPTVGMVLQAGQQIGQILPNNNRFKVKLMIPNGEIGNVKKGDIVKYSFISFPYTEYGFLQGSLEDINVTSELNPKTGLSYYIATASLNSDTISNKQGKTGDIKLGMACDVKIISRKEKMLYYILNQLGLKTNNI